MTDPTSTTRPDTVIATLPPCPSWCSEHPRAMDPTQVHRTDHVSGPWFAGDLVDTPHSGAVRLTLAETFDIDERTVTRDKVTVELLAGYLEPGGSTVLTVVDPRGLAAALLEVADLLDAEKAEAGR